MVLKKGKSDNNTLFIDATNECVKVTNNNRLTPDNIDNIVSEYTSREDKDYFARLVSYDEIKEKRRYSFPDACDLQIKIHGYESFPYGAQADTASHLI